MGKSFFFSALIHGLLVGVLFFAPGMRRIIYTGDRIQPVYLVKSAKRVPFKEEVTFVRRRVTVSSHSPIEVKSLKEKISERYKAEKEKKKERETPEEKIAKEKSIEAKVKETSLLLPSNFPYNWYIEILKERIYTGWSPPSKFSILQEEAVAVFSFRILKDGTIERIRLKRSSKIEILDQSAKKSLESIKGLPPLPDSWKEGYLDVTVRFRVEG